ncbi:MAG: hypothetical protein AAB780_00590 [Patescibacteria group bacterium]
MPTLLALLVFVMTLTVAVLYGCWWLIPVVLGVAIFAGIAYACWRMAGAIPTGAGAAAWWAGVRDRVLKAAVIFAIFACLAVLGYCLWNRFAPECADGCLSHPPAIVSDEPITKTVEVGREWSEWFSVPLNHKINWERTDVGIAYEAQVNTPTTEPVKYPAGEVEHVKVEGRLRQIRYRLTDEGSSDTLRIKMEFSR